MKLLFVLLLSAASDAFLHLGGNVVNGAARRSVVVSADPPALSYAADTKPVTIKTISSSHNQLPTCSKAKISLSIRSCVLTASFAL